MIRRLTCLAMFLSACTGDGPPPEPESADAAAEQAQAVPDADIWLATLEWDAAGALVAVGDVTHAVARRGYDNQPFFRPDGMGFWYTAADDLGETDIHFYDLASGEHSSVTATAPESEYSANPVASGGGFSAIRVEADSLQRLWRFDLGGSNGRVVFEDIAPVGYHAWADERTIVMFVLGDPATLQVADVQTGDSRVVAEDIGRSIRRIPGSNEVSFVQRLADGTTEIRRLNPASGESELIAAGVEGGDFHAWTPDGVLLQAHESRVYAWASEEGGWTEIGDLTGMVTGLTRLAVSPDGTLLAIVGEAAGGG